jgi:hypothetical protein
MWRLRAWLWRVLCGATSRASHFDERLIPLISVVGGAEDENPERAVIVGSISDDDFWSLQATDEAGFGIVLTSAPFPLRLAVSVFEFGAPAFRWWPGDTPFS